MRKDATSPRSAAADDAPDRPPPARRQVTPVIVLVRPQLGENIGASARAMANFGLDTLRLVAPRDTWPNAAARANAAGADRVLDEARLYATPQEAVEDLHFVLATTARARGLTKPVLTPEHAAAELHARIAGGQHCGVLFGPEKNGLTNDEVALADAIVTAPVNPAFASLNLAQSVLLIAYEWLKQSGAQDLGRATPLQAAAKPGLPLRRTRPAARGDLIGFFEHLERELDACGFLRPPEKRPSMVRNIRSLFMRLGATEQEVRTLRGIVSALTRASTPSRRRS